jgi:hypothetical protein
LQQPITNGSKRLLVVTAGNLRQNHLYVRDHVGFLPDDCIGPSRKGPNGSAHEFEVILDGLNQTIKTDLPSDPKTGKPRGFLRDRSAMARFYKHHNVRPG